MIPLQSLQNFFTTYLHFDPKLDVGKIDPYMTNGLMVKGKDEVQTIGFGVSASMTLFEKAEEAGCDALVVHHSFNLPAINRYDQIFQDRLSFLVQNQLSLFGYHFLLDAHPEVGNNVQLLKAVGATPIEPYMFHGAPWGWIGGIEGGEGVEEIQKKLLPDLSKRTVIYDGGPKRIKRIAAVSGKGAPSGNGMQDLLDKQIDLYITGEAHEWNRELFTEAGIHFIAGGHYHTEVFGLRALMENVQQEFPDVRLEWLDVPNDI